MAIETQMTCSFSSREQELRMQSSLLCLWVHKICPVNAARMHRLRQKPHGLILTYSIPERLILIVTRQAPSRGTGPSSHFRRFDFLNPNRLKFRTTQELDISFRLPLSN